MHVLRENLYQKMKLFRAALLTAHNAPLGIVQVAHEPVGQDKTCSVGQVRIDVLLSGICGAQLGEICGSKNPDAPVPRLLGHEGVGIVREVGSGVDAQLMGRKVCIHWRENDGVKAFLPARYRVAYKGLLSQDTISGGHVVTFSESVVVSANRVTPVPDSLPDEVAALLGCSLSTALGTIEQEARLRGGESVLILGCGGVGINLILAAKAFGAGKIVVMDKDIEKSGLAKDAGATYFQASLAMLPRFDVIIDTTGVAEVIENTIPLLSGTGRYIMLGQTKPGQDFKVKSAVDRFYGEGSQLIWSQGGRFRPSRDLPRYVAMYEAGRLNLDCVVSHTLPLERINEGLYLVRAGQAGRVMISMKK